MENARGFEPDVKVRTREFKIGCVGAGMIMAECHLAAYREAGFPVVAIGSRTRARAEKVAERWGLPKAHETPAGVIEDRDVEILDLAFPPDQQPALIRHALTQPHIKAILAQKPLALSLAEAIKLRDEAAKSGKIVSVNQNMRYDQSMRVLKQIIDKGELGEIVFAEIDMHAIPHWQPFLAEYDRLTISNMSVHHLDVLRFLLGDPEEIATLTRKDPRTRFKHSDGIVVSTLKFPSGAMALSLEDVWSGPRQEGYKDDQHIAWRVDGTDGVAKGTIGWPTGVPSTLTYASAKTTGGDWISPRWTTKWFPQAFIGVMEQLQYAVKTGASPALSIADNVKTMALVEAAYRSIDERRTLSLPRYRSPDHSGGTLIMMQAGVFTGYFPYGLEETAKRIRALGFNTVQLDLHFKDIDLSAGQITNDKAKKVADAFRDNNLPICCVSGYTNITHPDEKERKRRVNYLKEIIRNARYFGSRYVISETGTFNTESDWVHHPKNKTEEGFEICRKIIADLARTAHDHGAMFLLETYVNNVVGSVEETVRMFAEVDHPGLGLLMDPTNYFEAHNIDRMDHVLNQVFDTLSDKIKIAHAKDVKRAEGDKSEKHEDIGDAEAHEGLTFRGVGEIELPAPGLGALNYDLYLTRLAEKHPNIPVIIEHLTEDDVPRAKKFLDGKFRANGV